jgi:hypothetical protein
VCTLLICYSTALDLARRGASLCLGHTRRCQGGREAVAERYIQESLCSGHHPLISFTIMRCTRTEAGNTINKDLDTGGYTAKTCEAIAAMTGATEHRAKSEAVPPQAGRGYIEMTRQSYWMFDVPSDVQ